jgi:hypothetical protein
MSKDLASALFWLSVAIFVCLEAFTKLKLGSLHQPGPGFFPFWGGVLFATLSLILLLRSLRSRERLNFGAVRWSALVLVLAALLIYLLFLEALGFVIVTFCFLLLLFRFGEIGARPPLSSPRRSPTRSSNSGCECSFHAVGWAFNLWKSSRESSTVFTSRSSR